MNTRRPIVLSAGNLIESVDSEALAEAHICGSGSAPTLTATGLTAGATVTLTTGSTDLAGEIVLTTTGLATIVLGQTITLTFATPFANRPFAQVTPSGQATTTATTLVITTTLAIGVLSTTRLVYNVFGQSGG